MAEKMAASLEELRKLQEKDRCVVLQGTAEIGRTHLTRLLDNGWLQEVMKGWYIAARPGTEGDTTVWYTSFWYFIAKYAAVRLGGTMVLDGRPVAGSVFGENDRARTGGYQIAERP